MIYRSRYWALMNSRLGQSVKSKHNQSMAQQVLLLMSAGKVLTQTLPVALARAPETASRRQTIPDRVTIFTDAQAAIKRMILEEPGHRQTHALQARKHIAALRRPDVTTETRWCPAHKGAPGNEKADEWAKLAVEEPDARFFFLFIHYSHATYLDHGEDMYSPFPVRCPRSGGPLQAALCPPPRPIPRRYEAHLSE